MTENVNKNYLHNKRVGIPITFKDGTNSIHYVPIVFETLKAATEAIKEAHGNDVVINSMPDWYIELQPSVKGVYNVFRDEYHIDSVRIANEFME